MMRAGRLNRRCTLQQPGTATDALGQPIPGWTDVATVWAAIRPTGSSERLAASQMQSGQTHVITVRHSTALAAAIGSWRIAYGARKFDVIGLPRNHDEAGRWLVFDCVERI